MSFLEKLMSEESTVEESGIYEMTFTLALNQILVMNK